MATASTNNSSSADSSGGTSWQAARDRGKAQFQAGDFRGALASFTAAIDSHRAGAVDQQLLLSNAVACQLQLGDAQAALTLAQQCVNMNPSWSKGHVRLASAYSLLGQSNDACNALQTALRCDPGNRVARQMLVQELGRDRHQQQQARQQQQSEANLDEAPPAQNPEYRAPAAADEPNTVGGGGAAADEPYPRPQDMPQDQPYPNVQRRRNNNNNDLDDPPSFTERLQFRWQSCKFWYDSLSDDARTALHVVLGLLLLYVAFGGRFGFENYNSSKMKGNYGDNNAYEQYRRKTTTDNYYDSSYHQNINRNNDYTYANSWGYSAGPDAYNNSSRGGGDGFFLYMGLTFAALYLAHWLGLSPWQIMLLLNMAGGGRRRRRFGGGGMMYGGGGFGGAPRGRMRYGRRW